jgi:hypothetical protein
MRGEPEWKYILKTNDISTVLMHRRNGVNGKPIPLNEALGQDPEWKLVFEDDRSLVFVRDESSALDSGGETGIISLREEVPTSAAPPKRRVVVPPLVAASWKAVVLEVEDKQDGSKRDFRVEIGDSLMIGQLDVSVVYFLPAFAMGPGYITSSSNEPVNPAAGLEIREDHQTIFANAIFSRFPEMTASAGNMERLDSQSKSVRRLQRKLYRAAKSNGAQKFYCLYDEVCRPDVVRQACGEVKANRGAPRRRWAEHRGRLSGLLLRIPSAAEPGARPPRASMALPFSRRSRGRTPLQCHQVSPGTSVTGLEAQGVAKGRDRSGLVSCPLPGKAFVVRKAEIPTHEPGRHPVGAGGQLVTSFAPQPIGDSSEGFRASPILGPVGIACAEALAESVDGSSQSFEILGLCRDLSLNDEHSNVDRARGRPVEEALRVREALLGEVDPGEVHHGVIGQRTQCHRLFVELDGAGVEADAREGLCGGQQQPAGRAGTR